MSVLIETRIGELLIRKAKTLATAESCTGGLMGDRITSVPGSSSYYLGGVIAYSNEVKEHVLEVPGVTLLEYGAVSEQTALAMASGVRALTGADFGLSTTGIAGPGGGTPVKPVGLTWIAVVWEGDEKVVRFEFLGDRGENKRAAVASALELLLEILNEID